MAEPPDSKAPLKWRKQSFKSRITGQLNYTAEVMDSGAELPDNSVKLPDSTQVELL